MLSFYKNNIILIGFPSCGKTTFGQKLAKKLNYQFIDTDSLMGKNCRIFYQENGKELFRLKEKEVIKTLENCNHSVIATGGGSVLDSDNVAIFKKIGLIIYISIDKNTIKNRIFQKGTPAFLDGVQKENSFEEMYKEREPLYKNIASIILNC